MLAVLLVVHLLACVALVIVVLLQRSEGGALGMGGGGAGAGLMSGRGVAGVLVKVTMGLAAAFFVTSLTLTRLNTEEARRPSAIEQELLDQQGDAFTLPDATAPANEPEETSVTEPAEPAPSPDVLAPVLETPGTPAPQESAPETAPESGETTEQPN